MDTNMNVPPCLPFVCSLCSVYVPLLRCKPYAWFGVEHDGNATPITRPQTKDMMATLRGHRGTLPISRRLVVAADGVRSASPSVRLHKQMRLSWDVIV